MTTVALPVVAPADVRQGADVIECPPQHAKISAERCKTLCASIDIEVKGRGRLTVRAARLRALSRFCKGCPIGPIVAAQLGAAPAGTSS